MRLEVSTTVASYEVLDIDLQGRIRSYKYGNQVTTVNNFDVASGKLRGIQASLAGGSAGGVFNHSYEYDSLANLTKRVDSVTGVSEGFAYDGLNRLTNYSAVGGALSAASPNNDVQVMYDVRGNITYKSDVGQYWYDSARPNRMTAVTLSTPAAVLTKLACLIWRGMLKLVYSSQRTVWRPCVVSWLTVYIRLPLPNVVLPMTLAPFK